ncbi:Hypothetical protein NTJ_01935 [Nesidiocoris tenuis]|uniref:Uncharacterized protein n=1 Tax=Nesidiocoris tenuis TaxID=355587 RepID=A0ABN7A9Y8_9HEMI|nr:Hypothetical protein NTJ_01935 [Nesidiocoris tenuis]
MPWLGPRITSPFGDVPPGGLDPMHIWAIPFPVPYRFQAMPCRAEIACDQSLGGPPREFLIAERRSQFGARIPKAG